MFRRNIAIRVKRLLNFNNSQGLKYNYFRPSEVIKFIDNVNRNAAFRHGV
jgi:hypothetical protein